MFETVRLSEAARSAAFSCKSRGSRMKVTLLFGFFGVLLMNANIAEQCPFVKHKISL